jgi:two-component system, NtrC family, sensor histidine kinase HydH
MDVRFRLRVQDALLTVMFGALILLAHDIWEKTFILGLAVLQLVEGRIPFLTTLWGRTTSVVLQLMIVYLLIGYTGGVTSSYYLMLLLPLVSTASYLGLAGTLASSIMAVLVYLSFLLFVDFKEVYVPPEQIHILVIRCLPLVIAAVVVNSLAATIRTQSAKYKLIAEQLTAAEAAMRRSERLAALGQLSAGLAHELRNPLGSIKGSADLLARSASRDDPMAKELTGIISAEVDRTNSLVTRFLDFARPLEPRRESTDVTSVIDRAVVRAAVTQANVEVVRDYSTSLPRLAIDPELMEQVFLNLVTNASQASAPGGLITIRTRQADEQAEVSVIDHGCGIPPDKIETIFNPFVTTKQNGVGLGLAIVAKIVDGHGGKMSVESEPGRGSTFRVLLPIPPNT